MISEVEVAMFNQQDLAAVADYPWNKVKQPKGDPFDLPKKDPIKAIFDSIQRELDTATKKHGAFNSRHEGWAVIKEEVDELWEAVKRNSHGAANREAIQVAAMAVRFILDNK